MICENSRLVRLLIGVECLDLGASTSHRVVDRAIVEHDAHACHALRERLGVRDVLLTQLVVLDRKFDDFRDATRRQIELALFYRE